MSLLQAQVWLRDMADYDAMNAAWNDWIDPANPPEQRIPRNAQALWNLGAHEFTVLFHDGRIEVDETRPGGIRTPLAEDMVGGFATLLSAQTMFPVLSPDEMAGHYSENEI